MELTAEQKNKIAQMVVSNWQKWDDNRSEQVTTARAIMQETYLNQPKKSKKQEYLKWKSDVKLNALYNIKRAKKSLLWHEIWANPAQMFDVRGTDKVTEERAKLQKASIVDALEKMEIGKQYDKAVDDLLDIGEMILKTDWEQKTKIVKRQKRGLGFRLQNVIRSASSAGYRVQDMQDVELPYYENARVETISPLMFVFDAVKYKIKNKESWDSILKIYKRFDTLSNIQANRNYTITQEQIAELRKAQDGENVENEDEADLIDKSEHGSEYSVLFVHGDFNIGGKIYKNYIAEVLADKFLIRFEPNPMYINPFILAALEFDPRTKRGISPLKSCLGMCKKEEDLTNIAFDVQALTANPACFCNEELVTENNSEPDGTIPLEPGKLIMVENSYNGNLPQAVEVSASGINDLLNLLDKKISDISSVSSVMYGNIESTKRTATELSLADKGSSAQVGKELDIINQDFTIPMIKNVAELLAMFKSGTEYIYAQENGKNIQYAINDAVRQSEYTYRYEDRNAINDRKNKFQEVYQLLQGSAQLPQLNSIIDWKEAFVTALEMTGFDNTDKFLLSDTPINKLTQQLEQVPQELQQQVVGILSQQLQQMEQQYQQQQQQNQMIQQAQNQVQMQLYRDNTKMPAGFSLKRPRLS